MRVPRRVDYAIGRARRWHRCESPWARGLARSRAITGRIRVIYGETAGLTTRLADLARDVGTISRVLVNVRDNVDEIRSHLRALDERLTALELHMSKPAPDAIVIPGDSPLGDWVGGDEGRHAQLDAWQATNGIDPLLRAVAFLPGRLDVCWTTSTFGTGPLGWQWEFHQLTEPWPFPLHLDLAASTNGTGG